MRQEHLACHVCDTAVSFGHRSHRGMLTNAIASLGASVINLRAMTQQLRSKRWSKQFKTQRERDMATLAMIELQLAQAEGAWYGFRFLEGELYGGKYHG